MSSKAYAQVQRGGDSPKLTLEEVNIPQPDEHELVVKNSFVAMNPTDVQSLDNNAFGDGTVLGCDFVGQVEQVGKNVSRHKKGDIFAALIWGGEIKGHGAYANYTLADELISFNVPKSISPEAAASASNGAYYGQ